MYYHTHEEPAQGPAAAPARRRALSVLVVEDNEATAALMGELLRRHGHRVRLARDGEQALDALAEGTPDVLLLDIRLPGIDGHEVARRVAAEAGPGRKAPLVVALTGLAGQEERSQEAGVDLHLHKPVDPEGLLAVLRRFGEVEAGG